MMRFMPCRAGLVAILLLHGAFAVPAGASDEPATIVFHEDLVIGLDPGTPLGRVADIGVDSQGNIYVLDTGFMTIHKFAPDGTHLGDLGREGEAPGEFYAPACMTIGPGDDVYIAGGMSSITVIHPDGSPGPTIRRHVAAFARSIRVDAAGQIFVASFDPTTRTVIQRYAAETFKYMGSFGESYAAGREVPVQVEAVYAGGLLDITADGGLCIAQLVPQTVRLFTAEGDLIATHQARFKESPVPEPDLSGEGASLSMPVMTSAMVALENGTYLTALWYPEADGREAQTVVDIYDHAGRRLASCDQPGWFGPQCRDGQGRLYAGRTRSISEAEELPVVVRYRMKIVTPDR